MTKKSRIRISGKCSSVSADKSSKHYPAHKIHNTIQRDFIISDDFYAGIMHISLYNRLLFYHIHSGSQTEDTGRMRIRPFLSSHTRSTTFPRIPCPLLALFSALMHYGSWSLNWPCQLVAWRLDEHYTWGSLQREVHHRHENRGQVILLLWSFIQKHTCRWILECVWRLNTKVKRNLPVAQRTETLAFYSCVGGFQVKQGSEPILWLFIDSQHLFGCIIDVWYGS